jgi:hypothetical protein
VARRTIEYKVAARDLKTFFLNSFWTRIIVPLRRNNSLFAQEPTACPREKVRPQLEYPPLFSVPVTDGVIFLTGDDTTINDHY